jgi:hypothetical protein
MPRYVNELAISKSPEESDAIIQRYLSGEGFRLKTRRDGEEYWQKGGGWVSAPQFVNTTVRGNAVKIEAWIKFAWLPGLYSGEMDLTGFFGFAIKSALKRKVTELEKLLSD